MARYIDAEKIDFSPLKDEFDRARAKVMVLSTPTADVVEVVRCRDCVYCNEHHNVCHYGEGRDVKPDHYCSYGERKDEK